MVVIFIFKNIILPSLMLVKDCIIYVTFLFAYSSTWRMEIQVPLHSLLVLKPTCACLEYGYLHVYLHFLIFLLSSKRALTDLQLVSKDRFTFVWFVNTFLNVDLHCIKIAYLE